jgi:hypothetical protein
MPATAHSLPLLRCHTCFNIRCVSSFKLFLRATIHGGLPEEAFSRIGSSAARAPAKSWVHEVSLKQSMFNRDTSYVAKWCPDLAEVRAS